MRKTLIAAFVLVCVVSVAGTVMSQGVKVNEGAPPANPLPAEPLAKPEPSNKSRLPEMINQMKGVLSQMIVEAKEPATKEVELMKALDKYLATEKLTAIIAQLEDVIKTSPGTEEARRAEAAIQLLKLPAPATYDPSSIPVFNPNAPGGAVPGAALPLY